MQLVVLPGMDGGADLSRECRRLLAEDFAVHAVEYPNEALSTAELGDLVLDSVDGLTAPVLIAESFSGPVAIETLRRQPERFAAAVLVCTFVVPPRSSAWRAFVRAPVFSRPPPRWAIRRWMVGAEAPDASVDEVRAAIARVAPSVMAARVRSVLSVDARAALAEVTSPLLGIRARHDRLVDPKSCPEAHAELETATIDAPHLALHTRPSECAAVIRDWVRAGSRAR